MSKQASGKEITQRQLRVGEQIRHILAEIFVSLDFYDIPALAGISVTVSEVRVSADMHHATVYVLPLGRESDGEFEKALNQIAPQIRYDLGRRLRMKSTPRLYFKFDASFMEASYMEALIHKACEEEHA